EELIAAAHAGCFSMALAFGLGNAGWPPASIRTAAELSLERDASGPAITGIHLSVVARVPGVGDADFQRIAEEAKRGCLVSRLLAPPTPMPAPLDPAGCRRARPRPRSVWSPPGGGLGSGPAAMNGILSRGALLALSLGMAWGGATKSGTAAPP